MAANPPDLRQTYIQDIALMLEYTRNEGLNLPADLVTSVTEILDQAGAIKPEADLGKILLVHGQLCAIIAPATPRSLAATNFDLRESRWLRLLMIGLILFAVAGLVGYVASLISLGPTPAQNPVTAQGQLTLQSNFLFAAMIGAAFSGLLIAYDFIKARSFDPDYFASYVIRFVLGLLAGVVLANLGSGLFEGNTTLAKLGPGIIALLGGYSAAAVREILDRLVDVLLTAVRGTDNTADARMSMAKDVLAIAQAAANAPGTPPEVKNQLDGLLKKLQR